MTCKAQELRGLRMWGLQSDLFAGGGVSSVYFTHLFANFRQCDLVVHLGALVVGGKGYMIWAGGGGG